MLYIESMDTDIVGGIRLESAITMEMNKFNSACLYADIELESNMALCEHKLIMENGTMDDATMLFSEAVKEAVEKKKGFIATMLEKFRTWLANISASISKRFGKSEEKVPETPLAAMRNELMKVYKNIIAIFTKMVSGKDVTEDIKSIDDHINVAFTIKNAMFTGIGLKAGEGIAAKLIDSKYINDVKKTFEDFATRIKSNLTKSDTSEEKVSLFSKLINTGMNAIRKYIGTISTFVSKYTHKDTKETPDAVDPEKTSVDNKKENKVEKPEVEGKETPDEVLEESALDNLFEMAHELGLLEDDMVIESSIFDI